MENGTPIHSPLLSEFRTASPGLPTFLRSSFPLFSFSSLFPTPPYGSASAIHPLTWDLLPCKAHGSSQQAQARVGRHPTASWGPVLLPGPHTLAWGISTSHCICIHLSPGSPQGYLEHVLKRGLFETCLFIFPYLIATPSRGGSDHVTVDTGMREEIK